MASILVTGGAGFIGSHLVERLVETGEQVTVLDNFNDFYAPAIKHRNVAQIREKGVVNVIEGDIRDAALVRTAFQSGFDEVVHLAAMAGVRPSIRNPVLYQEVNLMGTMNILECCRDFDIERLIFASSSSVYGNNEKVPFAEDDRVDHPISPYAATKKAGELLVHTCHHLYGIKAACLRFFTVYGPRQRPEMAINQFTDLIMRDQPITLFGDGQSSRDYTYIDDIIDGIAACRNHDFDYEIINLGRSDTVRLIDLVDKLETALGKQARIERQPPQPGDVERTFADVSKAKKVLGYEPKISIDEGLAEFANWFRENRG